MLRRQHHYAGVLALILISLSFQLAAPNEQWARFVLIAIQGATLLVVLAVSGAHRWVRRGATAVVAVAVIASGLALLGDAVGPAPLRGTSLLLVALAPAAIAMDLARELRETRQVTISTMFGVLCIYLMVGTLFAFADGVVGDLSSSPFFAETPHASQADYTYFSFATLTTVGYGDLAATLGVARAMAIAEALIGQIYLVTVVAVIVGGLGRGRRTA